MNLEKIKILYNGVFAKDFKFSTNGNSFYYNVETLEGCDKVYRYSKEEDEEISYLKEIDYWTKTRQ